VLDLRGGVVTIKEIRELRERAASCSLKAGQTTDPKLKKYWEDLADNWRALEKALIDKDGKSKLPS
jgi:hypothetical protein